MRTKLAIVFALTAALFASSVVEAAEPELVVIVNSVNTMTSLKKSQLSKIFLRELKRWPAGQAIVPVDQPETSAVRERFCRLVFARSAESMKMMWQQMIFSGRGTPPPQRPSDGEIVEFVKATPGAIGYVTRGADVSGTRILQIE